MENTNTTATSPQKYRSRRNRSLEITEEATLRLQTRLIHPPLGPWANPPIGTIWGDCLELMACLPSQFVDLLILDPPYNLNKDFNGLKFAKRAVADYTDWLELVIVTLKPLLKSTASVYICGDWLSSASIFSVASRYFNVRNRITWEREKGRGAKANWKNASEDIWFCTLSDQYTFNVDAVKLRRKVLAPYKNAVGDPKDWQSTDRGNFRDTHPSNLWTDITIPFWSMAENTDHPTQKSEKLLAKLLLASSEPNDFVFDPFVGSGTTSVVAKKLGRRYLGIEQNQEYCLFTERRLELVETDKTIQGLADGVFWERNTLAAQRRLGEVGE
jgi:site-specific DNA-methyltransferase (adenine-specific)